MDELDLRIYDLVTGTKPVALLETDDVDELEDWEERCLLEFIFTRVKISRYLDDRELDESVLNPTDELDGNEYISYSMYIFRDPMYSEIIKYMQGWTASCGISK